MIMALDPSACSSAPTWRLWIDRCGGYDLKTGERWSVGGARPDTAADIQVQSDWRRNEGWIVRQGGDYFWKPLDPNDRSDRLLGSGDLVPTIGAAQLKFTKPSPLSSTALLTLTTAHRFNHHVDASLLVDQTVLVGPTADNHIRCSGLDQSAVILYRNGVWQAKLQPTLGASASDGERKNEFVDLVPGRRVSIGELDMTLEQT